MTYIAVCKCAAGLAAKLNIAVTGDPRVKWDIYDAWLTALPSV